MNHNPTTVYPNVDAASIKWHKPSTNDALSIKSLSKKTLDVLYNKNLSDAYCRGYAKSILHAIQNLAESAEDKEQM